jgi:hypothetical protein
MDNHLSLQTRFKNMSGTFDPFRSLDQAGGSVLNTIKDLFNKVSLYSDSIGQKSLIELTSPARVEPITVISGDCVHLDYASDVLQCLQSIFTAYYLQSVALMSNKIDGVSVVKTLDPLNPNRQGGSYFDLFNAAQEFGAESFKDRLPSSRNQVALAFESENPSVAIDPRSSATSVNELANLSVGKLVTVTISNGKTNIVVPVSVRLLVNQLPDRDLIALLSMQGEDVSFGERYHKWRAGQISFISDLMLCQDLITEQKKILMNDKTGVVSEIVRRANNNKRAAVATGKVSLNSASSLYVISSNVAEQIEHRAGGKFANPHFRDKIFASGYAMLIAVIDTEFERVTFYHRGIAGSSSLSRADLRSANKTNGPDIGEILKSLLGGRAAF